MQRGVTSNVSENGGVGNSGVLYFPRNTHKKTGKLSGSNLLESWKVVKGL